MLPIPRITPNLFSRFGSKTAEWRTNDSVSPWHGHTRPTQPFTLTWWAMPQPPAIYLILSHRTCLFPTTHPSVEWVRQQPQPLLHSPIHYAHWIASGYLLTLTLAPNCSVSGTQQSIPARAQVTDSALQRPPALVWLVMALVDKPTDFSSDLGVWTSLAPPQAGLTVSLHFHPQFWASQHLFLWTRERKCLWQDRNSRSICLIIIMNTWQASLLCNVLYRLQRISGDNLESTKKNLDTVVLEDNSCTTSEIRSLEANIALHEAA